MNQPLSGWTMANQTRIGRPSLWMPEQERHFGAFRFSVASGYLIRVLRCAEDGFQVAAGGCFRRLSPGDYEAAS